MENFSWEAPAGKITVIQGRSGSGKTTLLRMLAGLELPDAGSVAVPGKASFLFQENRLLPWYTIRRNMLAAGIAEPDADAWLASVGLEDDADHLPDQLSGGMRRRAALARALAFPAPMLLLDEPFKELDETTKSRMISLVIEQASIRDSIIVVTHDREDATALGGNVVQFDGPPLRTVQ